jgi:hypothetical protein
MTNHLRASRPIHSVSKRSRCPDEQIAYALRRPRGGTAVADVCRQLGEENAKLKRIVAASALDKHILGEIVRNKPKADTQA